MDIFLGLVALIIIAHVTRKIWRYKTLRPLFSWKYNFGKRRDTLRSTLNLLEERGAHVLVETGVARCGLERTKADGGSTIVFGLWAKQNQAHLHSVDIDPDAIAQAQHAIDELQLHEFVSLYSSDSVKFLSAFEQRVDFLYLDSYDYHKTDVEIQRKSQQHHIAEFKAIEERLHENSIVLIDDCDLPNGGKGKLVIEFMTSKGWQLHRYEYQAILVHQSSA